MTGETGSTVCGAPKAKRFFIITVFLLISGFASVSKSTAQMIYNEASPDSTGNAEFVSGNKKQPGKANLSGSWKGTYLCAQGITNLSLVITHRSWSRVRAVFRFSANKSNPSVPSGSYRMAGTYNSKTKKIRLRATTWIKRPADYMTVDLAGKVSRGNSRMSGKILNGTCSTFRLVRR